MAAKLLTAREAANRLGIRPATLYDWLGQSDAGNFVVRGQPVTIAYYQGGPRGQGRILIESKEVDRLLALMRVVSNPPRGRRKPMPKPQLQHITAHLGRPDD